MVLDPGHSGGPNFDSTAEVDGPKAVTALGITFHPVDIDNSGIQSIDNGGAPGELLTMWRAALRIQKILRADGYTADLTKSSANENVGLLERVREAINDHATIAVSLHYTGGIPFGEANAHFGVTPQQVGRYRTNASNGDTIRFTNARVAAESQRDAKMIQRARAAAGDGVDVAPLDESFPKSRGLPAYGNISIVQVVDQRFPWIYNEDGDIGFNFHAYTTGIAERDRAGRANRAVPSATRLKRYHGDHPNPTRHHHIRCLQLVAGRSWRALGHEWDPRRGLSLPTPERGPGPTTRLLSRASDSLARRVVARLQLGGPLPLGIVGVYYVPKVSKARPWRAQIGANKRLVQLGMFATKAEAATAQAAAERGLREAGGR